MYKIISLANRKTNTADINQLYRMLTHIFELKSPLIATHQKPDADGLGCAIALFRQLRLSPNCNPTIYINDESKIPSFILRQLYHPDIHLSHEVHPSDHDGLVLVDIARPDYLEPLIQLHLSKFEPKYDIDHHINRGELIVEPEYTYVDATSSSVSEILAKAFRTLNLNLSREQALALHSGLIMDTRNLRVLEKMGKDTYNIAHQLATLSGLDHDYVYEQISSLSPYQVGYIDGIVPQALSRSLQSGLRVAMVRVNQENINNEIFSRLHESFDIGIIVYPKRNQEERVSIELFSSAQERIDLRQLITDTSTIIHYRSGFINFVLSQSESQRQSPDLFDMWINKLNQIGSLDEGVST